MKNRKKKTPEIQEFFKLFIFVFFNYFFHGFLCRTANDFSHINAGFKGNCLVNIIAEDVGEGFEFFH